MKGICFMEKGNIVFLNGVTSSGKTSIVKELSRRNDILFFNLGYDLFEETIPEWAVGENDNYAIAILAMYEAAKGFSDQGQDVLIDGLIMNMPGLTNHYQRVKAIFEHYPLQIVHVYCPFDICRKRNIIRGDRRIDQSERQWEIAEKNIDYRLVLDTSELTVDDCADIIIKTFA